MLEVAIALVALFSIASMAAAAWKLADSQAKTVDSLRDMVHEQGQKLLARDLQDLARHEASRMPDPVELPRDDWGEAQIEWMRRQAMETGNGQ